MASDSQRAEKGTKEVFFLSVEIYLECLYVFHCSERGLAVFGLEIVVVLGDVSNKVNLPSFVGLIVEIRLVIEEVRFVFSRRFQ